ncbi:dethiobiotin synthase [Polytolypa hystricis UAMH7299]|uniref:Dethiobiotin synthase n=1 Tax=Polytolypa hystricis (strain UAMH7299) TaxID=1447883 RepID=A0A2B7Y8I8_POLH7|nr:dethiobiotin synthase [Polytolypa hystricis UAMH7299]
MSRVAGALWRSLPAWQVYGANTGVGKTVLSTILCKVSSRFHPERKVWFLKPVSTGPLEDADDGRHLNRYARDVNSKCLYQFNQPVSPHLAARRPSDTDILDSISQQLGTWAKEGPGFAVVETAGGVLSPGPNGSLQADLYRPLRFPVVLVADPRLGGISSTIAAYESLSIRGYDISAVTVFTDAYYKNHEYLEDFFGEKGIRVFGIPFPPARDEHSVSKDEKSMQAFYEDVINHPNIGNLLAALSTKHERRIGELGTMAARANDVIWYPFTQHQLVSPSNISVIDSAYGDCFQTFTNKPADGDTTNNEVLQFSFDGSASWWTQGLGHGNPDLSLSAAYAAGRYGHVMLPGGIHEPALSLAEDLIDLLENPRLKRVFYSDNGSTGMEIALKMGLRVSCDRYGWDASQEEVGILGLSGSYHGDTIGTMDCSEPSTYNKRVEWYRGRGYWFKFPTVKMCKGQWVVEVPEELQEHLFDNKTFSSLGSVFNLEHRKESDAAYLYRDYIKSTLQELVQRDSRKFGALIIEPLILGAGGMIFADPLFQHTLVQVVRENPQLFSSRDDLPPPSPATSWSGLPVIFDEVFTGLYRLGRRTSASFLDVHPDISVHAKLLTGGLLPLSTTLASEDIFNTFLSPQKTDALLHGHSYTAHAVGCQVALTSLKKMLHMEKSGYWNSFVDDWTSANALLKKATATTTSDPVESENPVVWSSWSHGLVRDLSYAESVEGVFALGSVLSISFRDESGGGYTSAAASGLQSKLAQGSPGFNVHSRVLGNVLYLMASMTSKPDELRRIEQMVRSALLL